MTKKITVTIIGFLLLLLVFAPIIYLIQFVHLSADDYCRAYPDASYYLMVKDWYIGHNGRYVNSLLSYLPIYKLFWYRLSLTIMAVAFVCVLYIFLRSLLSFYSLVAKPHYLILLTGFIALHLISQLPAINEFFFWFAGATVYLLPILFLMLLSILFFSNNWYKTSRVILASLLIILINGSNEMAAAFLNLTLLSILLYRIFLDKNPRHLNRLLLLNVVSWVSTAALLLAPGSGNRITYYPEAGDLFYSSYSSFLSSGNFFLKNLLNLNTVVFMIVLLIIFHLIGRNQQLKQHKNLFVMGLISFLGFTGVLFTVYYATGELAYNKGRIGNFIHLIFAFLLIFNIMNFVSYLKFQLKNYSIRSNYLQYSLFVLIPLFIFLKITSPNIKLIFTDIVSGKVNEYRDEVERRFYYLRNTKESDIKLSPLNKPQTITVGDITQDSDDWVNECFTSYVNHRFGKKIRIIKLE